jgi:hypothetical protein
MKSGFKNEIGISGVSDEPGALGNNTLYMEAILYILAGEGYTIADRAIDWKGTLHVQGLNCTSTSHRQ